jgi:TonB family protein
VNGDTLHLEDFSFGLEDRHQRIFRATLIASVVLHVAVFLTSPYWQSKPAGGEAITISFASLPSTALPDIPRKPHEKPITLPVAPKLVEPPPSPDSMAPLNAPPATREEIRARIANQGRLKVMSGDKRGAPDNLLSDIRIPGRQGGTQVAAAGRGGIYPGDGTGGLRTRNLSIEEQVVAAAKAPKELKSQTFKADSGLQGEISGGIEDQNRTSQTIITTIKQYQSGIKYAYNKELMANPNISGKITVAFVILPDGSVRAPEVRQSTVNWPPLEEAVVKRMKHWKFPSSRSAEVKVVFPFVFHPEM